MLSIAVGVNDTLVTFFQGRPTDPATFERRYTDVLDRTRAAGVEKLIIVEPFFVDTDHQWAPWRERNPFVHEDLATKRPIVRALARRHGAAFVPLQDAMSDAARRGPTVVVAQDGVHPSPLGHLLIARLWLEAYDSLGVDAGHRPAGADPSGV